MVRRDVRRFSTKYWSIHSEIEENVHLNIKRNHRRTKSYLTLKGLNFKTRLPKSLFKSGDLQTEGNSLTVKTVNLQGKITLAQFRKILKKGKELIAETEEILLGEKALTACYAEGGQLSDYVYCIPTGKHWQVEKYLRFILTPLLLNNIANDEEFINDVDIKRRQRQTNFFDFYPSARKILEWLSNGGYNRLLTFLDSLNINELEAILHLRSLTVYLEDGLKKEAEACEKILKCRDARPWYYPEQRELFQGSGALGLRLTKGKISWDKSLSTKVNCPTYVIKAHYAPTYSPPHPDATELNVFQQRWAYCTVRRGGRIVCHSPLLSLPALLDEIDEIPEIDASAKTSEIIKKVWEKRTLTNLCIRTLRRLFHGGHPTCLQDAPPKLRQAVVGR